eukprot:COSAG02_NODE_480_length_21469_cov_13.479551_2_plen_128_part_00
MPEPRAFWFGMVPISTDCIWSSDCSVEITGHYLSCVQIWAEPLVSEKLECKERKRCAAGHVEREGRPDRAAPRRGAELRSCAQQPSMQMYGAALGTRDRTGVLVRTVPVGHPGTAQLGLALRRPLDN